MVDFKKDAKSSFQVTRRIDKNLRVKFAEIFESELAVGLILEESSKHSTSLVVIRESSEELICLDL